MSVWLPRSSCIGSESDGKIPLIFLERDLFYGIIKDLDETIAGDRFFYKEIDLFSLDFTFDIARKRVSYVACQLMSSGTLDGLAPETYALDDPFVDDEISLHTFIV